MKRTEINHKQKRIRWRQVKKKEIFKGIFPLNVNDSDRVTYYWKLEGKTYKEINITYEIKIRDTWETIIRYDDHGGEGLFHKHIRISLEDKSEVLTADNVKRKGRKKGLLNWAINDIKKNYLIYRKKFLKVSGIKTLY